jgi:DNA-directed RNA polymerase specialized sigma24 family protein
VLRVATALVGHDDAEDAAQEALTRAWRAWGTLRDTDGARSWLLRITVNVCREWLRGSMGTSRRMVQPLPDDTQAAVLFDLYAGTSDHTGALDLRAAVRELPGEQRLVVVLRFHACIARSSPCGRGWRLQTGGYARRATPKEVGDVAAAR